MSGLILVVDDVPANVKILASKLESEYYNVITAYSGKEALQQLNDHHVDVVLLDIMMPEMDGYEVCSLIKSNNKFADIPIIMVTALDDIENRVKGLSIGADEFLTKPVNDTALYVRVRSLLRLKKMIEGLKVHNKSMKIMGILKQSDIFLDLSKFKILTIVSNDDSSVENDIKEALDKKIPAKYLRYSGSMAELTSADMVIIEYNLNNADSFDIFRRMSNSPEFKDSMFVLIVEESDLSVLDKAISIGFDDFIVYPIDASEFMVRVQSLLKRKAYQIELRKDLSEYVDLSVKDSLTKLFNKRYFEVYADQMITKSKQEDKSLYIFMIDIDDFKSVNDVFGHLKGDSVLAQVADLISKNVRAADFTGRYGGEEFVCMIYDVTDEEIHLIAKRLVECIQRHDFGLNFQDNTKREITISLGGCKYKTPLMLPDLVECADKSMYEVKTSGKNNYKFCNHAIQK